MISVYVTLIKNHRKTIDQVPQSLRAAVIQALVDSGYDTEGNWIDASTEVS